MHSLTDYIQEQTKAQSFSITIDDRKRLYDKEFNELMQMSNEELVKLIIGERPI